MTPYAHSTLTDSEYCWFGYWETMGRLTAANGFGILSNPCRHGTPEFNYWVDGWCAGIVQ